ncbi:MAG: DUF4350 domain-containing protein [Prevotella sp.]
MKGRTIVFFAIAVVFILTAFATLLQPVRHDWYATYSYKDKDPLGCFAFDSIMNSTLKKGYSVQNLTFSELKTSKAYKTNNILYANGNFYVSDIEANDFFDIVKKGAHIMIAGNYFRIYSDKDSIFIDTNSLADYADLEYIIGNDDSSNFIPATWVNTDKGYSKKVFNLYRPIAANTLIVDTTQALPLAEITVVNDSSIETQEPIAATIPIGKGKITFVSTPIAFTNVGILDPHTNVYLHRLMAQISDKPIIRIDESIVNREETEPSILSYITEKDGLKTAFALLIITGLVLLIMLARRKQHIIPIIREPKNASIMFAKQLGNLYKRDKVTNEVIIKRYQAFLEDVYKDTFIHLEDTEDDSKNFAALASRTGLELSFIEKTIKELRFVSMLSYNISEADMIQHLKNINKITNKLSL